MTAETTDAAAEQRARAMMEAAFEGIALHDKGVVVDANAAFARQLGYEPSELPGLPVLDLVARQDRERVTDNMAEGFSEAYELTGVRKDGSTFHAEVRGRELLVGGRAHRIIAVRDITTFKETEALLEQRVKERTRELSARERELEERNRRLERELSLASELQQNQLPDRSLRFGKIAVESVWLPSFAVGGDVVQVHGLADGKFAVLLADVTGHGVGAALFTMVVSAAFARTRGADATPGWILETMNEALEQNIPTGMFFAAAVAVVDPASVTCSVANAGLSRPRVVRGPGSGVEELYCNNLLLGLTADYRAPNSEELELAPGETLWLLSDGIEEIRDENGAFFEQERLASHLGADRSLSEILDEVLEDARAFARPRHEWDDITLLGLRHEA